LIRLWASARATLTQPDEASIRKALALVDYRDLILDPGNTDPFEMTAGLRSAGQSVDLGGIGKGFTGDRILEIYRQYGVTSAYSNLGGNVVTLGAKPDGSPWYVGIQHPRQENSLIGSVAVMEQTVVTSGDYQRFFTDRQGKRCHHILDPKTGYPSDSGLTSVSIITGNSLAADALSTILFVVGLEKGLEFLKRFAQTDAVFVDSDLHIYVTQGLRYRFQADRGISVTFLD
jgi:thiamine biosynthesis lipoprotein